MRAASGRIGQQNKNGFKYRRYFSDWMQENGFGEMSRSARAWSLALFDSGPALTQWFRGLPSTKQNRLLQPQSIVGAFRAATMPPKPVHTLRIAKSAWRRLRLCLYDDQRAMTILDDLWKLIARE
jgi:hypothetical protein